MKNCHHFLSVSLIAILTLSATAKAQTTGFYSVKTYGATGNGKTVDTRAIDKAIETAAAAGGGTVYFPAGDYLSVTIHLKSNVGLYLDHGATIIADEKGYDLPEKNANEIYQDYGHSHFHNSLIFGENLENISITGPGKIWGKGLLRTSTKTTVNEGFGNKTISLRLCRNVILRDFTVQHGGWFVLLLTGVDNMTIDNLKMDTNRDGMDIISCKNVRVSNCFVNSPQDDGICLKSDYSLNYARSLENVTITNCQVSGYDEGSLLDGTYKRDPNAVMKGKPIGRIKLGTESNGGYKNVTISNCVFDYCRGLALETVDGALLEDVTITNITMRDIVNTPIFIRLGARMRGPEGTPVGSLKRVIISNVIAYNVDAEQGALISGIPGHDIEDLTLSNIRLYFKGGGTKEQIVTEVPELEKGYPEPSSFKTTPSYGFFIRHVKYLKVSDVEVSFMQDDMRPAYVLDNVTGADFQHIRAQKAAGSSTFMLKQVKDFNVFNSIGIPTTKLKEVDKKEL
ncbi:MAG: glycoside hydrolase family 28 protein [Mucilaginibacter sp.]|uniref:rhamnogalacturonidase n=1 Tax=Mucilaginibacter sp. TaxID=1882438 RepID=UPI00326650A8